MLKPAQLYREELNRKLTECWYNPRYQYYFLDCPREFQVPDTTEWRRDFVCVNSKDEIVGYFAYHHDDVARSLSQFGLISFTEKANPLLIRDCERHIQSLVDKGLHRMEWWAVSTNSHANEIYEKIINSCIEEGYYAHVAGHMHDCHFFDGCYHDSILYEILFEE